MGVSPSDVILTLEGVGRRYDDRVLFENITLSFLRGAKIGVIGPNGAGKSTLLRIMAGADRQYDGKVIPAPGLTIGYVPQEPELDLALTVRENVEQGVQPLREMLHAYDDVSARLAEDLDEDTMNRCLEEMNRLQDLIEARDVWELDRQIEQAMAALRTPPPDAPVKQLSGGERRRVALCRTLMAHPELLLLDEPTNHLDADSVAWLEKHLQGFKGTVILITHDRYFLDNVVGWMLEIDRGTGRPYKGNYSAYLEQRQEVDRQRKKQDDERTRLIAQELEWVRANPKGRTTKSKARIQRYEELVQEHQKILRQDLRLQIPFSRRLGDKVLEVRGLGKSFDGRVLMHDLSFELPPGAILGVVGANGTGKTTLVRMILGQEEPDAGEIVVGPSVDLCYLDQSREELAPGKTVFEEITGGHDRIEVGGAELNARSYVARFNFRGSDQTKLVGTLSGGERNRVQMAKMLARGGNLVILDEPTNDLDLSTLRVLEDALLEFPGCAIVVTHDRWFLDRIATHILAFEGDGETWFHAGNYESYREERAARRRAQGLAAEEAKGPHRKLSG